MSSVCDKNFTTFLLRRHIAGANQNVKHRCGTCKAVFTDKDVLKQHVLGLHYLKYRYVCFCNIVKTFLKIICNPLAIIAFHCIHLHDSYSMGCMPILRIIILEKMSLKY